MGRTEIAVTGMTCGACTAAVTQVLEDLPGVNTANVSLVTERAVIDHADSLPAESLVAAIEDAGFDAAVCPTELKTTLQVFGMTCAACSTSIESVLSGLDGVSSATVNLTTEQAVVMYDGNKLGVRRIVEAVKDAGFEAILAASTDNTGQIASLNRVEQTLSYRRNAIHALLLGLPIFIICKLRKHMPAFLIAKIIPGLYVDDVICLLLVTPIQLIIGRRFYGKAYRALKARAPNMDVLVATSTTCAYLYSVIALGRAIATRLDHHQMYLWEASAMIILFVVFGKYLENKARGSTSMALSQLIALVPEVACIVEDGKERQLPTDMLEVGDYVVLRPGERVPADGLVISGESHVNESMLTGESRPVGKHAGDHVFGGTVNELGVLHFRVTQCGANTKLAQIVNLVKDAQASRAPIQRYADWLAARFVPGVLCLAAVTFCGWMLIVSLMKSPPKIFTMNGDPFFVCLRMCISVIVVACPCALGLATPTAVMVATGVGAQHGILVKGGVAFERLSTISVVLFDKTGTLTTGKMSVVSSDLDDEHWPLLGAVESLSEHPIAKALVEEASRRCANLPAAEIDHGFEAVLGRGIRGQVDTHKVLVGSAHFMQDEGLGAPEIAAGTSSNDTTVFVAVDGHVVGQVSLADRIRPEASAVVEALLQRQVKVGLVSGDAGPSVECAARATGIDKQMVWAETRPEDKVRIVKELQQQGHKVAMVGDGINDSPALATADIGISLEGATQVAVESADVVLVRSSPIEAVPASLDLGKAALYRIKANLLASVIYNVVMIPISMGILLPFGIMMSPMMASAAMAASSVSVVLSSLLLKKWVPVFASPNDMQLAETHASKVAAKAAANGSWVQWLRQKFRTDRGPDYVSLQQMA